jgi:hypothetical protein
MPIIVIVVKQNIKVKSLYDADDEHAEEDGNVEIDEYADEVMPDAVDTMIQLEADLARGK